MYYSGTSHDAKLTRFANLGNYTSKDISRFNRSTGADGKNSSVLSQLEVG